jgi:hypothetical protein
VGVGVVSVFMDWDFGFIEDIRVKIFGRMGITNPLLDVPFGTF